MARGVAGRRGAERDRRHGRRRDEAIALTLARAAFVEGDVEQGVRLGYERATVAESVGFTWWRGVTLWRGSRAAPGRRRWIGQLRRCRRRSRCSARGRRPRQPSGSSFPPAAAALAARQGDADRAGRLWGPSRKPPTTSRDPPECCPWPSYAPYVEPVTATRSIGRTSAAARSIDEAVAQLLAGQP